MSFAYDRMQVIELLRSSMPPLGDKALQMSGDCSLCATPFNNLAALEVEDVLGEQHCIAVQHSEVQACLVYLSDAAVFRNYN